MKERYLLEDDRNYLEQLIPRMREDSTNLDLCKTTRKVAKEMLENAIIKLDEVRKELGAE